MRTPASYPATLAQQFIDQRGFDGVLGGSVVELSDQQWTEFSRQYRAHSGPNFASYRPVHDAFIARERNRREVGPRRMAVVG